MIHGEAAYVLGPCESHEQLIARHCIRRLGTALGKLGLGGANWDKILLLRTTVPVP